MKKFFFLFSVFLSTFNWSQTDFSANWEDFYSYNNVKDFVKVASKIYAIADNAVFIYDVDSQEIEKLSSIQGLSGEITSSIHYSDTHQKLIIGYQNGLLEIIDAEGKITLANDIQRLSITGEKAIKHITEYNNKLYFSTPFAIVVYDIEKLEYGETYFIGDNSSVININQIAVFNDVIYAVTELGVYTADATSNTLIDFNNWQQPQGNFIGNFKSAEVFNNQLFVSKDNSFYKVNATNLEIIGAFGNSILQLKASENYITATTQKAALYIILL